MKIMVTGHRKLIPLGHQGSPYPENNHEVALWQHKLFHLVYNYVKYYAIDGMACNNITEFITGMAIGADQMFCQAVIKLSDERLQYILTAAIPFAGQESRWPPAAKNLYAFLLNRCHKQVCVSEGGYASWKMQKRNEWMVDNSQRVLAIWNGLQKGGTWNCINYALKKGLKIDCINSETLVCSIINS